MDRVLIILTRYPTPNFPILIQIVRAWRQLAPDVRWMRGLTAENIAQLKQESWQPRLIVLLGGECVAEDLLAALTNWGRACGALFALWSSEDPDLLESGLKIGPCMDIVASNCNQATDVYKKSLPGKEVLYLPLAAALDIHDHQFQPLAERVYDLSFVGSCWPNRIDFFAQLMRRLSSSETDWRYFIRLFFNHEIMSLIRQHPNYLDVLALERKSYISHRAVAVMYSRSRLAVNLLRVFKKGSDAPLNNRYFEIGLAGAYQFVQVTPGTSIPEILPAVHVCAETDPQASCESLMEVLGRMQSDPRVIEAKILESQTIVREKHTYKNRIQTLLQVVEDL